MVSHGWIFTTRGSCAALRLFGVRRPPCTTIMRWVAWSISGQGEAAISMGWRPFFQEDRSVTRSTELRWAKKQRSSILRCSAARCRKTATSVTVTTVRKRSTSTFATKWTTGKISTLRPLPTGSIRKCRRDSPSHNSLPMNGRQAAHRRRVPLGRSTAVALTRFSLIKVESIAGRSSVGFTSGRSMRIPF